MVENSDKLVNIAYRGTVEFRERLQRAALDRGVKVQELIDDLINQHVFSGLESSRASSPYAIPQEDEELASKFLRWIKRPKTSRTDKMLVEFMLKELEGE